MLQQSSYNALRHGLAAKVRCQPAPTAHVDRLARAMCGNDEGPVLFAAARAIAEHEFVLNVILSALTLMMSALVTHHSDDVTEV